MKRSGILNIEIPRVIASMGNSDYIVIPDVSLSIPDSVGFLLRVCSVKACKSTRKKIVSQVNYINMLNKYVK